MLLDPRMYILKKDGEILFALLDSAVAETNC